MTTLKKLEKELEGVKIELMVHIARAKKLVSGNQLITEIDNLMNLERNLHVDINQEKQKGL